MEYARNWRINYEFIVQQRVFQCRQSLGSQPSKKKSSPSLQRLQQQEENDEQQQREHISLNTVAEDGQSFELSKHSLRIPPKQKPKSSVLRINTVIHHSIPLWIINFIQLGIQ